jgi:hypothetical protein
MGYTTHTKQLVQKVLGNNKVESVVDLGSCNDYDIGGLKPPFISDWYESEGIYYVSIDLAGDNDALPLDLSQPLDFEMFSLQFPFDLVVDAGTGEHLVQMEEYETVPFHEGHIHSIYPTKIKSIEQGYYNGWLNKFNLCKAEGHIISINPKTGSWPHHCYTWVDINTYLQLSKISGLNIIEIGEHAASGNSVDGWEIFCVMKKLGNYFPSLEEFHEKVQVYAK